MEENRPNYYAIIPANVRYDEDLKDKAKLLYGEITCLSNEYGCCFASNKYFANLYKVSTTTISLLIKNLIDRGYITSQIVYKEGSKEILNRYLKISKEGYLNIFKEGIKENLKDNNTSINNTSINNIYNNNNKNFKKPNLDEVKEYCKERKNNINAEQFIDYYESKGWMIGKNKMKDWKAAIRTWERNKTFTKEEKDVPEWFDKEFTKKENKEELKITEEDLKVFDDFLSEYAK